MRLILSHPALAARSCHDCQQYVYDHAASVRLSDADGQPIPRPSGTFAPCRYGPSRCAKGSPDAGRDLSAKNRRAWLHYRECRAVGAFPDDPLVRRNAALIEQLELARSEETLRVLHELLARLAAVE